MTAQFIDQALGLLWLVGIVAKAAEAYGAIWWPWPLERSVSRPSGMTLIMPIGDWLFFRLLWFVGCVLLFWPLRGLIVLICWLVWRSALPTAAPRDEGGTHP